MFDHRKARKRRLELRLSRTEVAAAAGISERQYARYEAGTHEPRAHVHFAIEDALGFQPRALFRQEQHA